MPPTTPPELPALQPPGTNRTTAGARSLSSITILIDQSNREFSGLRAQWRKKNRQKQAAHPYTILGCGCGLFGAIGVLLVFLMLMTLSFRERHDARWSRQDYAGCQRNLTEIKEALWSYRQDHHHLPVTLMELRGHYLDHPSAIRCPLAIKELGQEYRYYPDAKAPTDLLVVCDNHGQGRIALRKNGTIKLPNYLWKRMTRQQTNTDQK